MTLNIKHIYIYAAAAAVIAAAVLVGTNFYAEYKINALERAVEQNIETADRLKMVAFEMEKEAETSRKKIEYLERNISEIKDIARRQDEEIKRFNDASGSARSDVERARRVRTIAATADELCAKLAELGHACD